MKPIEALADSIMQYEGWHVGSRSWRNRNPGNLRPYSPSQQKDDGGYRIFVSLAEGWQALLSDLMAKFAGSHGLGKTATLIQLLNVYAPAGDANNPNLYTKFICSHLSEVLGVTVTPLTTLGDKLWQSS